MNTHSILYNKKYIYALLMLTNPEFMNMYKLRVARHELVAAKLISHKHHDASAYITCLDNNEYKFKLDLDSRTHQSKGNWVWVKQVKVLYPIEPVFNLIINPRVIDLPYTSSKLCAHWLLRDICNELHKLLNSYL